MKAKFALRLPLYAFVVDLFAYFFCSFLYMLGGVLDVKLLSKIFYLWAHAHVPISLKFVDYYEHDFPWSYLGLAFLNTIVLALVVGVLVDIYKGFRKR